MKILHTADWHVGKVLKNQPRIDEQKAVLRDLVRVANDEDVDLVIVAGDLFETSAPNPQAQGLVMHTLMALRAEGRHVVVLAGNHDNARLVQEVYRPVLGELGMHVVGTPQRPDRGGTITLDTRSGERAVVAALPFLSHRYAVRAAEVLLHDQSQHNQDYANRVRGDHRAAVPGLHRRTASTSSPRTPRCSAAGGAAASARCRRCSATRCRRTCSRRARTTPRSGHLHRYQQIDGPCPIAYSGSPIALDFGEEANEPVALIVHATPDSRAQIRPVPLQRRPPARDAARHARRGRRRRRGGGRRVPAGDPHPEGQRRARRPGPGEAAEHPRRPDRREVPRQHRTGAVTRSRIGRTPTDLFADFLSEKEIEDPRLGAMFAELLDESTGGR